MHALRVLQSWRWGLALLALPFSSVGCGDHVAPAAPLHPVKGKVVFSKPEALSGLTIVFLPKSDGARTARGDIRADGGFDLKTDGLGVGAAEGEYRVRLEKPGGFPKNKYNLPISQEYFDEDGAFLSATVKPDTTDLPPMELTPIASGTGKRRSARGD